MYKTLFSFIEAGKLGQAVIFATPEGNFLSPKAVKNAIAEAYTKGENDICGLNHNYCNHEDSEKRIRLDERKKVVEEVSELLNHYTVECPESQRAATFTKEQFLSLLSAKDTGTV